MFANHNLTLVVLAGLLLGVAPVSHRWGAAHAQTPLGTAFTYQGQLKQSGTAVNDTCDCEFSLWDDPAAGTQVGPTLTFDGQGGNPPAIAVDDGLLAAELDFGMAAYSGEARWLQIAVTCPSGGTLMPLSPRQAVTAAPYALALPALRVEQTATAPNVIGGHRDNSVTAPFPGATISGGGDSGFENRVAFSFGTVGGGVANLAEGHSSTVAGGRFNIAGADQSTVGGGQSNTARRNGTVAGGSNNTAFNFVLGGATVAGGLNNAATGGGSTIGGGETNAADGHYATVPGGHSNQAGGHFSIAAGRRAKVRTAAQVGDVDGDEGTFVWADSTNADFTSTGPNQFLIRASGGLWFGTTSSPSIPAGRFINTSTGAHLSTGGTWVNASSRELKERFTSVNGRDVLSRVAALPIRKWNYRAEDADTVHMGPTAEDFAAAFGLGADAGSISTVDADGVALAAIQGLYEIVKEKDAELQSLRDEIEELKDMFRRMSAGKGE